MHSETDHDHYGSIAFDKGSFMTGPIRTAMAARPLADTLQRS